MKRFLITSSIFVALALILWAIEDVPVVADWAYANIYWDVQVLIGAGLIFGLAYIPLTLRFLGKEIRRCYQIYSDNLTQRQLIQIKSLQEAGALTEEEYQKRLTEIKSK